jgi:hypothetical protein
MVALWAVQKVMKVPPLAVQKADQKVSQMVELRAD